MRAYASSRTEAGIRELAAQRGYAYREAPEPRQSERAPVAPVARLDDIPAGNRNGCPWTHAEKRLLRLMLKDGKTTAEIAERMRRTEGGLVRKIRRDRTVRHVETNVVDFRGPRETRRIIDLVARMHGETFASVMSPLRFRGAITARQAAICAVKQAKPDLSSSQIGRIFRRDHTTVLYAMQVRGMTAPTPAAQDNGGE